MDFVMRMIVLVVLLFISLRVGFLYMEGKKVKKQLEKRRLGSGKVLKLKNDSGFGSSSSGSRKVREDVADAAVYSRLHPLHPLNVVHSVEGSKKEKAMDQDQSNRDHNDSTGEGSESGSAAGSYSESSYGSNAGSYSDSSSGGGSDGSSF